MIALFPGWAKGEVRWMDCDLGERVHPMRAGDVRFVAPEVSHTCVLHRKGGVLAIFLGRWRIEECLGKHYPRLVGTGSVMRLRSCFESFPRCGCCI